MADFSTSQPGADILAAYSKATRISPISETDKNQVLKDYGISVGWAEGKDDAAISHQAANQVLYKFRFEKRKEESAQNKLEYKKKYEAKRAASIASGANKIPKPTTPKPYAAPRGRAAQNARPTQAFAVAAKARYGIPASVQIPEWARDDMASFIQWLAQAANRIQYRYKKAVEAAMGGRSEAL